MKKEGVQFLYASSIMVFGEGGNNLFFVTYCGDEEGFKLIISTDTKADNKTIVLNEGTDFAKENIKKVMRKITPELLENEARNFGIKNVSLFEYQTLINEMLEPLLPKKKRAKN